MITITTLILAMSTVLATVAVRMRAASQVPLLLRALTSGRRTR